MSAAKMQGRGKGMDTKDSNTNEKVNSEPKCKRKRKSNTNSSDTECAVKKPIPKPLQTPSRLLRRTQSATIPTRLAAFDDSVSNGTASLDSGSESDLPDAFTLLKSPEAKQKRRKNGILSIRPELGAATSKPGPKHSRTLTKSASDIPSQLGKDDSDRETMLKVPGELVLACSLGKYYPARVLAQPAASKFRVEFLDGSKRTIVRKRIFTMYERGFYTCELGLVKLIGDEPVDRPSSKAKVGGTCPLDLNAEFEEDKKKFSYLVDALEKVKPQLQQLHECPAEDIEQIAKMEYRMLVFFGTDSKAKSLLSERVSMGHLNRAEFDFTGQLLIKWFDAPPRALENTATTSATAAAAEQNAQAGQLSSASKPTNFATNSQTALFVHEVLLPHAIKRLIVMRDGCTLAEAEPRMLLGDSEVQWADKILAARGISLR